MPRSSLLAVLLFFHFMSVFSAAVYHVSEQCGDNKVLRQAHVATQLKCRSKLECAKICEQSDECETFEFDKEARTCVMGLLPFNTDCNNTADVADRDVSGGLRHYDRVSPKPWTCLNGGTVTADGSSCLCPRAVTGNRCQYICTDCADWLNFGVLLTGGLTAQWIKPPASPTVIQVYCSEKRMYIMSRTTNSTSFNRDWSAYQDGFGDVENFWLGLENLHIITNRNYSYRFRISIGLLRDVNGSLKMENIFERYNDFRVSDETDNYRLSLAPVGDSQCLYSGAAFSTTDRDNDNVSATNCAQRHAGGWWYAGNNTADVCSDFCGLTGELVFDADGLYSGISTHTFWQNWAPTSIKMYLMNS